MHPDITDSQSMAAGMTTYSESSRLTYQISKDGSGMYFVLRVCHTERLIWCKAFIIYSTQEVILEYVDFRDNVLINRQYWKLRRCYCVQLLLETFGCCSKI